MAQEHQEYIQQKVNPILENLVTQLLLERPEHLAPFMIRWLSDNTKTPAAAALTEGVAELERLKAELEKVQEEVNQLEAEAGAKEAAPVEAEGNPAKVEDSDSEEEAEGEEFQPPPSSYMKRGPRASVSAEAYGMWNQRNNDYTAPVYPKTEEQRERIRGVLQQSFLFSSMEPKEIGILIDAMQERTVEAGTRLIDQGEDGNELFVVEEGLMNCFKRSAEGEEHLVKSCGAGDAFGELALLYNCPRAASVMASERSVLWQLEREVFNHIVKDAASKRRERYEDFLKSVPLLQTMDAYERSTLCDALQALIFIKGNLVVKQGDIGDRFFIVEEGTCLASKVYVEGTPAQEVMKYESGDYFGELSLLMNEPRAASVVITSDTCKLLTLSRKTFMVLLGPLKDILQRNAAAKYR
mmetsp:Transcript_3535/g.8290  ORF Transcript_3535/g.8290 Transcript_3535/m.8290 type:complete len:411 (-) Transcript_3535:99-1331(-)